MINYANQGTQSMGNTQDDDGRREETVRFRWTLSGWTGICPVAPDGSEAVTGGARHGLRMQPRSSWDHKRSNAHFSEMIRIP